MNTVRIAVIGSGFGLYGLLPAFNAVDLCKVISFCGKKTDRLTRYCNSIDLKNIYSDWKLMLNNEDLDAIAIAVTPREQYLIAKEAAQKKIHIFAEKPLAANVPEAKELYRLSKENNITTAVDFIFPEIDVWQKAKYLLDSGVLGKLKHISVNWNFLSYDIKNRITSWKTNIDEGGGALSFYFSHSLYYIEYLAGKIVQIKRRFFHSKESLNNGEVGVDLLLKFKNGAEGKAHLSCNSKRIFRHKLVFVCEKGKIILENNNKVVGNFVITIIRRNKKEVIHSKDIAFGDEDERVKIVRKLASKFIEASLHNTQMIPSFKEGLRVQELIEKIRKDEDAYV